MGINRRRDPPVDPDREVIMTNRQLQIIHTAKRSLGYEDADYRLVLKNIAGVQSSKQLDQKGFELVMAFFESVGFEYKAHGAHSVGSPSERQQTYWQSKADRQPRYVSERELRMIEQLQNQSPYKPESMVRRMSNGRTDRVTELYPKEGYALIEALKKIVDREANKRSTTENTDHTETGSCSSVSSVSSVVNPALSVSDLSQIEQDVLP